MQPTHGSRLFSRIWSHISHARRVQLLMVFFLMSISSFAEILSIGAILPFLGILTAPDAFFDNAMVQPFINTFGVTTPDELLPIVTVCFCLAAIVAGFMRLLLLWGSTRLSFAIGEDLGVSIYKRTLYQPYLIHVSRNSSEIISGIMQKTNSVSTVVSMMLNLVASATMLVVIIIALVSLDPVVAVTTFAGFGSIYGIVIRITRIRQLENGKNIAVETTNLIKYMQEGLGGIRDVLIDGTQEVYCRIFHVADKKLRGSQASNTFITGAPRFAIEALCILLLASLAFLLAKRSEGISGAIPVLGALALGAQRMLPILQQGFVAWSTFQAQKYSLSDAIDLLEQPLPEYLQLDAIKRIPFERDIALRGVSFRYSEETPFVLRDVDIRIPKGAKVGIHGATGGGKSTLLDLIMGLLSPTTGSLEIDGVPITTLNHRNWQKHIAHVPQNIFLSDTTIEQNIAFGIPADRINSARLWRAAEQAQILDVIDSLPEKFKTVVGERGVKLSGGQRQRIGIARALYKDADVIVIDEATSALDYDTERSVMEAINNQASGSTLIMIAHRLTSLKNCDMLLEVRSGHVVHSASYDEIIASSSQS
jgi:ABC-type multidrug transport system fused ATPase/permease subunit